MKSTTLKHLPLAVALMVGNCVMSQTLLLPQPSFRWVCQSADSMLNFSPASTTPQSFDSMPYAEQYTMMVVYKPVADTEASVWSLSYADGQTLGLTTHSVIVDGVSIRYADSNMMDACINTLRQSAPDAVGPYATLNVGDGNTKIAEVLYFNRRLSNRELRLWQSELAIRYGVTLGPVDYISNDGTVLWLHHRYEGAFHHRITGLCNDTTNGLIQTRSHSEMAGGMLTIAADTMYPGSFLLTGDNDEATVSNSASSPYGNGFIDMLRRTWRIQSSGIEESAFTLTFDVSHLQLPTDSLVLIVDEDIHLPTSVTPQTVSYSGVVFPTESSSFTLARGSVLWQYAQMATPKGKQAKGQHNTLTGDVRVSAYPNPTEGHYFIEVDGAETVEVTIRDLLGRAVATHSGNSHSHYRFEGELPSGNSYFVTVDTGGGSQTMKLVVR